MRELRETSTNLTELRKQNKLATSWMWLVVSLLSFVATLFVTGVIQ